MVKFNTHQLAVFSAGAKNIKEILKHSSHKKTRKARRKKKGTRRKYQKGGGLLDKMLSALFMAMLFSAYLIMTGLDVSMPTMIGMFADATNMAIDTTGINNFIEGTAIALLYRNVDWTADGLSRPQTCEEGFTRYNIPGYGELTYTTVLPDWAETCPQRAHLLGTVLTSVCAGIFMAFIGPSVIQRIADSTANINKDDIKTADQILAEAEQKIADDVANKTIKQRVKLTPEDKAAKEARRERRLQLNPPQFVGSIDPRALATTADTGSTPDTVSAPLTVSAPSQVSTTSTLSAPLTASSASQQSDALITATQTSMPGAEQGVSLTFHPDLVAQLQQSGDLQTIGNILSKAVQKVQKNDGYNQWLSVISEQFEPDSSQQPQLTLKDTSFKPSCQATCFAPAMTTSMGRIQRPISQASPDIEEIESTGVKNQEIVRYGGKKLSRKRRSSQSKKHTRKK